MNNSTTMSKVKHFVENHKADDFLVFTRGNVTAIALINPEIPPDNADRLYHRRSAYSNPFVSRNDPYNELYYSVPGRDFVFTSSIVTRDIEGVFARSFRGARTVINYFRELERCGG